MKPDEKSSSDSEERNRREVGREHMQARRRQRRQLRYNTEVQQKTKCGRHREKNPREVNSLCFPFKEA